MTFSQNDVWIQTQATVFSAEWISPEGEVRGCWNVSYGYRAGGEYQSGKFVNWASDADVTYRKNDNLLVEYSSRQPAHSRVPGIRTWWDSVKVPFAIGGSLGVIAIIWYIVEHLR